MFQSSSETGGHEWRILASDAESSANFISVVTPEYFRSKSNPSDPFHVREAAECLIQTDPELPNEPIFIMRIGEKHRFRISIVISEVPLPFERIHSVQIQSLSDSEQYFDMEWIEIENEGLNYAAMVLFDPYKLKNNKVVKETSNTDALEQRYIPLNIKIDAVFGESREHVYSIPHRLYCKMVLSKDHSVRQSSSFSRRNLDHTFNGNNLLPKGSIAFVSFT